MTHRRDLSNESRRRVLISPLRYPGGKGLLYSRLRSVIRVNELTSCTYVEPYAGGAGSALGLLVTGEVRNIVINDLDPALFAFWKSVTEYPSDFQDMIMNVPLSVEEWINQKRIYRTARRSDHLTLGFATFYLNRTNRSGILNGGPIGGLGQTGSYKIDARFNRSALSERIRLIGLHANRISVTNLDGVDVIKRFAEDNNTFVYADPPYFQKAGSLYMNTLQYEDHVKLADALNELSREAWVLTYDNVPEVAKLYPDRQKVMYSLNYSARRIVKAREVMVFSDSLRVPMAFESQVDVSLGTSA